MILRGLDIINNNYFFEVIMGKKSTTIEQDVYFYTFLKNHVNKAVWHFEAVSVKIKGYDTLMHILAYW